MLLCNKYSTVYTIAISKYLIVMPMYIVLLIQQNPVSPQNFRNLTGVYELVARMFRVYEIQRRLMNCSYLTISTQNH